MDLKKAKLEIFNQFIAKSQQEKANIDLLKTITTDIGLSANMAAILFPAGLSDILSMIFEMRFAHLAKETVISELNVLRVKDRIKHLLLKFFNSMAEEKLAIKSILKSSGKDLSLLVINLKISWQIVDAIWYMAGDKATDFNYYTKRILLYSVYIPSLVYWMSNKRSDKGLENFIDNLLIRVNKIGKVKSWFKNDFKFSDLPIIRFFKM